MRNLKLVSMHILTMDEIHPGVLNSSLDVVELVRFLVHRVLRQVKDTRAHLIHKNVDFLLIL